MEEGSLRHELENASACGNLGKVKECIERGTEYSHRFNNNNALVYASWNGHLEVVKYLVEEAGANVHVDNDRVLRWASCYGNLDVVRYLVEETGADIHAVNDYALERASYNGHLEIVKYLLSRGANHQIYDNPHFKWFCNGSQYKIIKYLWESGFLYFKEYPTLNGYLPVNPRKRFLL
jgi:ankyrin repeat protein